MSSNLVDVWKEPWVLLKRLFTVKNFSYIGEAEEICHARLFFALLIFAGIQLLEFPSRISHPFVSVKYYSLHSLVLSKFDRIMAKHSFTDLN